MRKLVNSLMLAMLVLLVQLSVQAQTGSIGGTVTDANGAVVPGASVTITGAAGQEYTVTTNSSGTFLVPAVGNGLYTVTVSSNNFKKTEVKNVKVDVGTPATVDVTLEAGLQTETVLVTSGGEVLQTATATVGTSIQGRQITETPIQSRDALDLVTTLPGTNTVGTVRTSSINGLPKSAISITIDGVDVQDSFLKSSDGFFTYVRPRIDAIDEVTVSTANPGAESSGDGAVGIRFVTRRGTNDYTGGLYWQHRDESLNANNWWNNRIGTARQKLRLNQFGGRVGGPIPFFNFGEGGPMFHSGKDRAFFFVNYEEYRIPEASPTLTRTVLLPEGINGTFRYGAGGANTVNLFTVAANNGLPSTPDPTVLNILNAINAATQTTGTFRAAAGTAARRLYDFQNTGMQKRRFLATRIDVNVHKNHSIENVLNYQPFRSTADFLNGLSSAFPGFDNAGAQNSDRWSNSTAVRSTLGQNIVNEARYSRLWGESGFTLVGGTNFFDSFMGGYRLTLGAVTEAGIRFNDQIRTSPTYDFSDNLTWIKGNHTMTFGGQYKIIKTKDNSNNQFRPQVTLGVQAQDTPLLANTVGGAFNSTAANPNFPGASATEIAEAAAIYAMLTGRVSGYNTNAYLGADGQYKLNGPLYREVRQDTYGVYAQDSWRIRPNLTVSFGVRWQPQTGYQMMTENFSRPQNFDQVFDVSGPGNLFSPGTLTGQVPLIRGNTKGERAFETDWNNFAPSIGVVWSPEFGGGFMKTLFGEAGKSVFRGGFSRAFIREGTLLTSNTLGQNPGGILARARVFGAAVNPFTPGTLFRTPGNPNLAAPVTPATPGYPRTLDPNTDSVLEFSPDLKTGYVDSWSFGYQRELDKNTVVEFRYVGNRGKDMHMVVLQNEINAIENGLGAEFAIAQANLIANRAAGRGNTFAHFALGDTSPLPITVSYLQAGNPNPALAASYTAANFTNATQINALNPINPNVQGFAAYLESQQGFRNNRVAAGRPANFINNCPTTIGFCFAVENAETSSYDSGVIELRRRLSNGLRVQASYTFGKAFTNAYAAASTAFFGLGAGDQSNSAPVTLRNRDIDNSTSQVDLRHAFKFDATYDLPFGKGRQFGGGSNWATNAIIGGWSIAPVLRWQSGSPILLENIQLVGMTAKDLQKAVNVYKDETYLVPSGAGGTQTTFPTYLPGDIITNTIRAYSFNINGYTNGAPTGRYIAPANFGNCQARSPGQCGFRKLVLYGPSFFKLDAAVMKKIQFTEKSNVELRATFFDVLNKTNWRLGGWTANVSNLAVGGAAFGQWGTGTTYQDPFGSNDPGGRIVDLSMRINF